MESIRTVAILKSPLENVASLGRRKPLFHRLMGQNVGHALFHLPINIQCWRQVRYICHSQQGENIRLHVTIQYHKPNTRFGKPYKIYCHDGHDQLEVIYFNAKRPILEKVLPPNSQRIIFGKADYYHGTWSIIHPDKVLADGLPLPADYQPVYPLTAGITNGCVQRIFAQLLPKIPALPEWLDPSDIHKFEWPSWHQAITNVHHPVTKNDLTFANKARQRLAYDELLSHQLALHLARRSHHQSHKAPLLNGNGELTNALLNLLPFSLTSAQQSAIDDIFTDMTLPKPMARLVQGDVGSGKTMIALMAMLRTIEANHQAALLAPTDILARQHFDTISSLCHPLGIHVALLTGRDKGKSRQIILNRLANHDISLIIGTHALIQDDVHYAKLGLAIIDEQHRFGVQQRLALAEKGRHVHMLAMTATPIPRTMILAHYGDMALSLIKEKPAGRLPIQTKVMALKRQEDVIHGVKRALKAGAKIFWVCPLVEESEALDISAAEARFQDLERHFGNQVGLIHGRMKSEAKDTIMNQFVHGDTHILVATTVIEVGVHVQEATIMIVEHAERFGLAQLHQLRGRIGRGNKPGTCLLLYGEHLSATGRQRLETMRQTDDGFKIAEVDLKLRGGGDILGIRQSGMPQFRLADFIDQSDFCSELLSRANNDAKEILRVDPLLTSPRGHALRCLLQLFDRDDAIKYTRS
jgi:ATP-dependent DNA helicase RecG